jgi:hypothetical protein
MLLTLTFAAIRSAGIVPKYWNPCKLPSASRGKSTVEFGDSIPFWSISALGELCQRALDVGIAEINRKTDLKIGLQSLERAKHRRVTAVTFSIEGASGAGC